MSAKIINQFKIPVNVNCVLSDNNLIVKGGIGEVLLNFADSLSIKDGSLFLDQGLEKVLFNTRSKLIKNAFNGVVNGFATTVNLHGVGYKVEKTVNSLEFSLGYSHKISMAIPFGISCDIKSNAQIIFKSADNKILGDFVAKILKLRKPNPYKLKGVLVEGQFVRKKEGKK